MTGWMVLTHVIVFLAGFLAGWWVFKVKKIDP